MIRTCPECGKSFDESVTKCPDDGTPTQLIMPEDDLIGQEIDDRFTIKSVLGVGGMGAVYRAFQHSMERDIALKLIRRDMSADQRAVKRFLREAKVTSKLSNPHTVTVFDFGQTNDGMVYIAMELLKGQSLGNLLKERPGRMEPSRAVSIADQILDSLIEAHSLDVLHRDLKPDNIFLLEGAGTDGFVKVLDFGIAKLLHKESTPLTSAGLAYGTPVYMSPEQAQAEDVDVRTDLYSVGVILFELLAGKPPFEATTPIAVILKKVQETAPTVYHVNPETTAPMALATVVANLLKSDPDERPSSAAEVKEMLKKAIAAAPHEPETSLPDVVISGGTTRFKQVDTGEQARIEMAGAVPTAPQRLDGPARRGRLPWILAAAAGLAGAVGAMAMFLPWESGSTPLPVAEPKVETRVMPAAVKPDAGVAAVLEDAGMADTGTHTGAALYSAALDAVIDAGGGDSAVASVAVSDPGGGPVVMDSGAVTARKESVVRKKPKRKKRPARKKAKPRPVKKKPAPAGGDDEMMMMLKPMGS